MVYVGSSYHPALVDAARSGNFRAIAHWLNQVLVPYGIRAFVGLAKPGCLKILIELQPTSEGDVLAGSWREPLVRYVCHRIWQLNSALIEGARVGVRFMGDREILWERSVRIVSPAARKRLQHSQLRTRVRLTSRQRARLKLLRSALMSGSAIFAFIVGGVFAFVKTPEQGGAVTSPLTDASTSSPNAPRSDRVQAAAEVVPVVKHERVADANDPTVTMMFAGDVTLSNSYTDTIGNDHRWAFAEMNEYRQADLAMVNLENPLTRASDPLPDKQFNFKADPDMVNVLKEGGVDLVNLANNHTMDYRDAGLTETVDVLDRAGIWHIGAGRNLEEARRPKIVDVKGQRIAFLGYYGELHAAGENQAGTNSIDEARIAQDIRSLRSQVDWIVVNYHWGEEKAAYPADWQVDLARFTIDQGADVVVGHHPHVLQGAEIYKGRPIAYSLGNFIFGGNSRSNYDTAVLKVSVKDRQMKVEFLPIEVRKYQPRVVDGDRASQILQQIQERSSHFQEPMKPSMVLDARPVQEALSPEAPPAEQPAGSGNTIAPPASPSSVPETAPLSNPAAPSSETAPSSGGFTNSPNSTPFKAPTEPEAAPSPEASPAPEAAPSPEAASPFEPAQPSTRNDAPTQEQPISGTEAAASLLPGTRSPAQVSLPVFAAAAPRSSAMSATAGRARHEFEQRRVAQPPVEQKAPANPRPAAPARPNVSLTTPLVW